MGPTPFERMVIAGLRLLLLFVIKSQLARSSNLVEACEEWNVQAKRWDV